MASSSNADTPRTPDPFEFLKALWFPMGLPMPNLVTPILDSVEIDKRIADLKSVENWLNLNLNVLRMTIQGLEMQKATLSAMQGMQGGIVAAAQALQAAGTVPTAVTGPVPAADAWWSVLQQVQRTARQASGQAAEAALPRSSAESGQPDQN